MNRDLNIKSTIRQILGVLISIMILMPFTVSSQTVTTTIDCANATTDINGNGYRWDLSNKILALDGIDLRTSQMMGIELPPPIQQSRYKETITSKEQAGPSSSISVPQSKTQAEP